MFKKTGQVLIGLSKLIASPVKAATQSKGALRVFLWCLHFLVIGGALVGLWWLNGYLELDKAVRAPAYLLRVCWLPTLFLLAYALTWFVWWTVRIAYTNTPCEPHADIADAWREGCAALEQGGVSLLETPLFLVLGEAASGDKTFCQAAGQTMLTPPTPSRADAPLRVWANQQGIFVSCRDASLLSLQSRRFAEQAVLDKTPSVIAGNRYDHAPLEPLQESFLSADAKDAEGGGGLAVAVATNTETTTSSEVASSVELSFETAEGGLSTIMKEDVAPAAAVFEAILPATQRQTRSALVSDKEEIDHTLGRLEYLVALLRRDRSPYCPHNGCIVLIPMAATEGAIEAQHVAVFAQHDLRTVREVSQISGPVTTVFCDLEQLPGCAEVLRRFPEEHRRRRFGIAMPHFAESDVQDRPNMLAQSVQWVCQTLAAALIFRLADSRDSYHGDTEREFKSNAELFGFLHALQHRGEQILRILHRGVCPETHGHWHPTGWFLAATGEDAYSQHGFLPGVIPQVFSSQNVVGWTSEARLRDQWQRRFTGASYVALVLMSCVVASFAVFTLW